MSTKRKQQAKNYNSAYSSARSKPSPLDHLLWGAINLNTNKRNDLVNVNSNGGIDSVVGQDSYVAIEVTIPVTFNINTDGIIAQPAGSVLRKLEIIPQVAITTAGAAGNDLDFSLGTTVGGVDLLAASALLNDGGAAVTAPKGRPLPVIDNYAGQAANYFATAPYFGPATTEASAILATTYSATARNLHFRFTPLAANLTASGKVTVIARFTKTY
tara:strand:+ start:21 stop:665 length:645 start_codon:yes stop_codon:yes gene_type:complete